MAETFALVEAPAEQARECSGAGIWAFGGPYVYRCLACRRLMGHYDID